MMILNEIVVLLVETVCARRKTTRISGADFPHEIVRSRFLKLDSSHIEFVMDCLQKSSYFKRIRLNAGGDYAQFRRPAGSGMEWRRIWSVGCCGVYRVLRRSSKGPMPLAGACWEPR